MKQVWHFCTIADIKNRAMILNLLFSLPYNQTGFVVLSASMEQNSFSSRSKGGQILPFWWQTGMWNSSSWRDYKFLVKYITVAVMFNMLLCSSKEIISQSFAIVQKQGRLKDSYIPRRRVTMERPQNSRLKLVAFNCDLDLESALLSYGFCTSSH